MRPHPLFLLILVMIIFCPISVLYADECDDYYHEANSKIEEARTAIKDNDYELAGDLLMEAAEYYQMITEKKKCRCPKIAKAAPGLADKYTDKAYDYYERADAYADQDTDEPPDSSSHKSWY